MKAKQIVIKPRVGYVQPVAKPVNAMDGELDGLEFGQTAVIESAQAETTEDEYETLPKFHGH